jgi:hypothetical protein
MKIRGKYQKLQHLIPDVMQMRASGYTLQHIAGVLGLSKQRISQISRSAKDKAAIQAEWGWPFTTRTYNVLKRLAVKDRDEAIKLYTSGHIHPNAVTGFGWKSYGEICEWLGVPPMKKRPKVKGVCPHCGKEI